MPVNTIRIADGSIKFIPGHVDPPLPDWLAEERMRQAAIEESKHGGARRLVQTSPLNGYPRRLNQT